jgi:hypothetical protein
MRFVYCVKSVDKFPGEGIGEECCMDEKNEFHPLTKIKNWRRILSNQHVCSKPIFYQNKRFRSVIHAYEYSKFVFYGHINTANLFSLESRSELSKGDGIDAKLCSKLNQSQITDKMKTEWKLKKHACMFNILKCKFSQCSNAKRVLLLTKDAELYHYEGKLNIRRSIELEYIREILYKKRSISHESCVSNKIIKNINEVDINSMTTFENNMIYKKIMGPRVSSDSVASDFSVSTYY